MGESSKKGFRKGGTSSLLVRNAKPERQTGANLKVKGFSNDKSGKKNIRVRDVTVNWGN